MASACEAGAVMCQPWVEEQRGDPPAPSGATSGVSTGKSASRCEASSEAGRMPPLAGGFFGRFINAGFLPRLHRGLHDRARFAGWHGATNVRWELHTPQSAFTTFEE